MHIEKRLSKAAEYLQRGLVDPARITYEAVLGGASSADALTAHLALSRILLTRGDLRGASEHMTRAATASISAGSATEQRLDITHSLIQMGEHRAANELLSSVREPALRSVKDAMRAAACCRALHLHHAALAYLGEAFAQSRAPVDDELAYHYAVQLNFCGEIGASNTLLINLIERRCANTRVHLMLARASKDHDPEWLLHEADRRLTDVERGSEYEAALHFTRFCELHRIGRYRPAWQALQSGNACMRRRLPYDYAHERTISERLREVPWSGIAVAARALDSTPQPIFIVGMPRSGTTLLERMLGRHPEITAIGELTDFSKQMRWVTNVPGAQYIDPLVAQRLPRADLGLLGRRYLQQVAWRVDAGRYFIDKQPPNFWVMGAITRALPDARIIVVRRDPMDVCFSNFKALFGDSYEYSYDFPGLAQHHRLFDELVSYWQDIDAERIHQVRYEALVQDAGPVLAGVLAYLGLPQDVLCLDPSGNHAAVSTLSSSQVREPIHTRALHEWLPYEEPLRPLQALLRG